jgi:hypothetical protein
MNWMFFGSDRGGETAAILMSVLASAKRHGIEPFACVRELLIALSSASVDLRSLLPDIWIAAHPEQFLRYRRDEAEVAARARNRSGVYAMSWTSDLSPPSPHLPDELGIKWGANKFECLRLLWPNRLPNLFEYHQLSPHFSILFEHQDRERLLTFRFGRFGDGVTNGLRRLETVFDPPPVYDDLSEDHWADPPVEDYESLYGSFLAQYEAALGAHEFRGNRRVDPHPESAVCLLNARDLAYWPLPYGRLQVALLLSQSKPAWNEPQWIWRSVQVAWYVVTTFDEAFSPPVPDAPHAPT